MVNVSGHRLSTAEIEAALIEHHNVAEAAVVGVQDELTGQSVNAFVSVKDVAEVTDALRKEFIMQVRKSIGPFAAPKAVFIVPDLPKTRSGKIMRRILRKILAGEEDQLGDITTVCSGLPCLYPMAPFLFSVWGPRDSSASGLDGWLTTRSSRIPRSFRKLFLSCRRPARNKRIISLEKDEDLG